MHTLRYRQIHLDFHTSPAIEGIGSRFDRKHWQETLKKAHVDSVTCFAVCHHGWSYYNTEVGKLHPHLDFDLTRAMYAACKEADINCPLYISAGVNCFVGEEHPEWRVIGADGKCMGGTINAGFKVLCFNTPYLDYLCDEIREVARLFPEADGIFLDIIAKRDCCCPWCLESMERNGLKAECEEDRQKHSSMVLDKYYRETLAALREVSKTMPIFQNSGHVQRGNRKFLEYVSHLELESLPTGGWGYDHFPMSAKYAKLSGLDFLGMTGKFHTTWGEFGGFKHPNALKYECAAMIAYGAKCSVGDQLHPLGRLDDATYDIIGQAYSDVEKKEPWCNGAVNVADVAILSSVAVDPDNPRQDDADTGAARILLEGHILFDIIDGDMDFSSYKMLVLPDEVIVNDELKKKLDAYLEAGGKLFLSGTSGLSEDGARALFDIGAEVEGKSEYSPDFVLAVPELRPDSVSSSPFVAYTRSVRLKVTDGQSLGQVYDPYFNRTFRHFCSHQHAPAKPDPSGYDSAVRKGNIMYLAHPVFKLYRAFGAVIYKDYVLKCMYDLLGDDRSFSSNLPSTARVALTRQDSENRHVLHLLYANTINRGGPMNMSGGTLAAAGRTVEVIDELLPLHDVSFSLKVPGSVKKVTLEPQGKEQEFSVADDGKIKVELSSFTCHQMLAIHAG